MIRINKNLAKFVSLAILLSSSVLIILYKILPLFQHSVYYCQQFIHSFSIKIPYQLGIIVPGIIFIVILMAIYKLLYVYFEIHHLRSKLVLHSRSSHGLEGLLKKLQLQDKVYVIESDKAFAFCFGIRYPKIYISMPFITMMNKKELEAVLLHERYHLNNRDSLTMLLASTMQLLFPFFPVVSDLLVQYKVSREIEADQEAIKGLGESLPVISVLKKLLSVPTPAFATASAIADNETLEPRIKALIKQEEYAFRKFKVSNLIVSLSFLTLFSALIIAPTKVVAMQTANQDTTMICLQGDACATWCKENNTVVPRSSSASTNDNASHLYSPAK